MKTARFKTKPEEPSFASKTKTKSKVFASSSKITDAKTKTQTPRPIKDEPSPIVRLTILCGDVQNLQARTQHKELELSLRIGSAFLA